MAVSKISKRYNAGRLTLDGASLEQKSLALVDGATVTWDLEAGNLAHVTLDGNRNFDATNVAAGLYALQITQDATTGSRVPTYNAEFRFPGGTPPTLSTGVNDVDVLFFACFDGTNLDYIGGQFNLS